MRSASRGFEPFEYLFHQVQKARTSGSPPPADSDAAGGGTGEGNGNISEVERWVTLGVLSILLVLAVPVLVLVTSLASGLKSYVALFLALPSGLVAFVALGVLGDLIRHRAGGLAVGGGVVGAVLCIFYYPALANQLSPKEVFETYRHVCPDGPLALLGVGGRTSAYYAGGQPQIVNDPTSAYQWLTSGAGPRRCLALKADELPKLNQLWRQHADPKTNLPILDARSSQILLAASGLDGSEVNSNPLEQYVLAAPPHPQRGIDANLDDKLQVLGIDVVDDRGRLVDVVSAGRTYAVKTYYRVLAPLTSEWEAFIHIDGYHRRHNGDHKPMNGKYPMSLWLSGDLLVDTYEFKLEPNFTQGTYEIYFGLFVGDTRLKIQSGPNDGENRVNGGPLRVQ